MWQQLQLGMVTPSRRAADHKYHLPKEAAELDMRQQPKHSCTLEKVGRVTTFGWHGPKQEECHQV